MTKNIVTEEYFKQNQYRYVDAPGFNGETITFKVKNATVTSLVSSGRIPSKLFSSAVALFEGKGKGNKDVSLTSLTGEQLKDIMSLLKAFCAEVMVEPSYEKVGEFLTDEMLFAIFGGSEEMKEVAELEPSTKESTDN